MVVPTSAARGMVLLRTALRLAEPTTVRLELDNGAFAEVSIDVTGEEEAPKLRSLLARSDQFFILLGRAVAVGTGFGALYASNADWGTTADYLTALLWGGTVTGGLANVGNLANRLWKAG